MLFWKKKQPTTGTPAPSISQRDSGEGRSHLTILDPREVNELLYH